MAKICHRCTSTTAVIHCDTFVTKFVMNA
ncbi:BnaA01g22320D [Brassica napus]|uniref:BnaA01g22320D protein n=1 Tax=Brassica napus TaxID=3708 RepID=A0A078GIX6_BRANA|nr:BnaA01g22320D [Brassica napus]